MLIDTLKKNNREKKRKVEILKKAISYIEVEALKKFNNCNGDKKRIEESKKTIDFYLKTSKNLKVILLEVSA